MLSDAVRCCPNIGGCLEVAQGSASLEDRPAICMPMAFARSGLARTGRNARAFSSAAAGGKVHGGGTDLFVEAAEAATNAPEFFTELHAGSQCSC